MEQFISLDVIDVRPETASAVRVTLRVPERRRAEFQFKPGQFMHVRASVDGIDQQRSYSICSDPSDLDLVIAIKRIPGGQFSTWANTVLRTGMVIEASLPQGRFILRQIAASETAHVLALAAGAGITPILSIARFCLQHWPQTRFTLLFGNRTIDDIMFREALEDLKDRFVDRFTLIHVLSQTEQPDTPFLEGRIDAEKIRRLTERLVKVGSIEQAFVCGPSGMIRDARQALFDLGMPRERVQHELFAPAAGRPGTASPVPAAPAGTAVEAARAEDEVDVIAVLDGARRAFRLRSGETVIDAALRAGIRVPYACKGGMCCTCRAKLVEGEATMRVNYSLEPWELDRGFLLTCQAVPTSPRLVVDYDQQ